MRRRTYQVVREAAFAIARQVVSDATAKEFRLVEHNGELSARKLNEDGQSITAHFFLTERDVQRIVDERLKAGESTVEVETHTASGTVTLGATKLAGPATESGVLRTSGPVLNVGGSLNSTVETIGQISAEDVEFDLIKRGLLARLEKRRRDVDPPSHTAPSVGVSVLTVVAACGLGFYLGTALPWYTAFPIAFLAGFGLGGLLVPVITHLRKKVTR